MLCKIYSNHSHVSSDEPSRKMGTVFVCAKIRYTLFNKFNLYSPQQEKQGEYLPLLFFLISLQGKIKYNQIFIYYEFEDSLGVDELP